ncbi:MAG: sulfatase-like hydrolase/transferase [Candidatus Aegiribacteria sp.]|nr:sulfatase-like hydrolase/transferase [Candidatus Aegiribacteria sp.]MBD3294298.1 sulfatase-like hydrolase/transferase [Candidatus Fermentibacteria bacterium]
MRFIAAFILMIMMLGCSDSQETADQDIPPNVLLLLIDTVRADHVHCYGYERDITPTLDSLAAEGIMWANVQAQAAWTLPAMATIFTGLTERQHLAGYRGDKLYGMSSSLVTLPEIYEEAGYQTSGFYNVPVMGPGYGFSQGQSYVDVEGCELTVDADVIHSKFFGWLDDFHDPATPFFSVLHYFDPHYPYMPPQPYDGLYSSPGNVHTHWASEPSEVLLNANRDGLITIPVLQRMIDLYDGEIAFLDSELRSLFNELENRGLLENTIVVVIADHGEEFRDHGGLLHGFTLFGELTHVPLIMAGPGIPEGEVDSTVAAQIDVLPTITAICDIQTDYSGEGVDLLSENRTGRMIPSSGFASDMNHYLTVRKDNDIVFWDYQEGGAVQFDLELDPYEQDSLQADSMLVEEATWYWSTPPVVNPSPVPNTQNRVQVLRNLGYCR